MRRLLPSLFLALCVGLAACGGDDDDGADPAKLRDEAAKSFKASERQAKRDRQRDPDARDDERREPFVAVATTLPIRRPPLPIQQYVLDRGHRIIARPSARDFFCDRDVDERRLAVEAFYREADKRFRAGGIRDFSLLVAEHSPTLESIKPLATAEDGKVELTKRGRGDRDC